MPVRVQLPIQTKQQGANVLDISAPQAGLG